MSSVRWSELNDDSEQVSDASSEDHHPHKNKEKTNQPEPTSLKKITSSPPEFQKTVTREEKIKEELQKLNNHKGDKVWIYVLDSTKNDPKVVIDVLNHHDEIEKVNLMNKGWNILLRKQKAGTLIENGLKQRGVELKMIFSNKNNEVEKSEYKKPQKFEKFPKRQYVSPNSRFKQTKSPKYKEKRTYSQKVDDQKNNFNEQSAKKKVKYVARDPKSMNSPDSKIGNQIEKNIKIENTIPEQHHEEVSSESPQISAKKIHENNHKAKMQNIKQPVHNLFNGQQRQIQNNKQKEEQKEEQIEIEKEKEQKQEKVIAKNQSDSDSSEELQKQRKLLEKKKGKKKKKGGKGGSYQDSNNPFAVFGN